MQPGQAPQQGQPAGVAQKLASLQLNPQELTEAIAHGIAKLEGDLKKSQIGSPKDLQLLAQIKDLYLELIQSLDSDGSEEGKSPESGMAPPEVGAGKAVPAL